MSPILQRVADFFDLDDKVRLVVVYGSVAAGKERPGSDVDIAVMGRDALSIENKIDLQCRLEETLRRPVDVVDLSQVNGLILKQILCKGKVVVRREAAVYGHLMVKMMDQQADLQPLVNRLLLERQRRFAHG
jgi:predicted nucleotidyltransferase